MRQVVSYGLPVAENIRKFTESGRGRLRKVITYKRCQLCIVICLVVELEGLMHAYSKMLICLMFSLLLRISIG